MLILKFPIEAWRDSEKREKQQNGPRSIDPLYVEKMKMVREEEDRKERERKSAAQRKLQELDEKNKHQPKMMTQDIDDKTSSGIGYTINDADKRDSYNNKSKYINDKYDYDYGRNQAGIGPEFKKSSFQSNLPPRFQKQHNIDRRDDDMRRPMDKSSASSTSSSYKPLHQQDSKNVPFAQQPAYEQRWIQYNKANQQQGPPPRRNMSSLSQSSSDDNRQSNSGATSNKPTYNRRRHESEEDDYGRYGGKDLKAQSHQKISTSTLSSAQITRSMSDSSEKLSDHNRSEKSTSREYLGSNVCWAEACEQSDKRSTLDVGSMNVSRDRRRVSESSAMSDDQPRTILQRNKPLQEQLQGKTSNVGKEKEAMDDDKKTVLNEGASSKNFNASPSNEGDEKKKEKSAEPSLSVEPKKSLEIIPEKEQNANESKLDDGKEASKKESSKEDDRHTNKRSPRYESSRGGRGNYGGGGGSYRGNWGNARRGGGHSRGGNRYDYSDSEEEEGYEGDWNRKNSSGPRKDLHHRRGIDGFGQNSGQKEGFSPRGEPSRRGRGASSGSFHRNSNSINAPGKSRIDNYGPPSSKSPFGSNDEKSSSEKKVEVSKEGNKEKLSDDDRIKQKQKALSDGLMNKNMKDNSNVALQKADDSTAKHSTEQPPSADQKEKKTPEDDKASNDSKRSSSSYNANRNNNRHDKNSSLTSSAPTSAAGKTVTKLISSSTSSTTQHPPASSSHYTSSSMSKPQDSRGGNNNNGSNYRGNVNAPASGARQDNNNRMSSAPRFTNKSGNGTNRVGGNSYWESNKSHPESMHDDKMILMQQLNATSQSLQQQQQQMSSNMMGKSEQVMKQQQQSMHQASQQQQQAAMLDGASLPKTTLIFENTSLRSGPPQTSNPAAVSNASGMKRPNVSSQQQQQSQMQASMGQQQQQQKEAVAMGTTTINEMIEQQSKEQSLSSALQNLSFSASGNAGSHPQAGGQQQKNDMVDMNSFKFSFDTPISQLTDDSSFGQSSASHPSQAKASSLGLVGAKTGGGNNILNTDSLNMKVASCKKVWEEASDHSTVVGSSADDVMANFVAQQHIQQYNNMSSHSHHTGLSPQSFGYNTGSSNDHSSSLVEQHFVNKVNDNDDGNSYPSPQQHMNAHVMHSQSQQQANLNMKAAEAFATTANVCKVKPTQMHPSGLSPPPQMPQQSQMHQQTFYPTPNYPNMPTIPSPPVVYNSAQATASGLYSYNMDARAQMYGYPTASAGANNSLSFNAFMQASAAPTHEVYQNLSQYRAAVQPYNQTPQLNNPNAVLISSATGTSNSMMGSKSNSQQIGAIGSKSSAPPQSGPSAAAAGNYNQQYMSHLYHQQHANSYYPNSTAQQANPYYNTSGSAATGSYGMFSGTSAPHGQQQMPNYGSVGQFPLNSQMLNNLVVNQQYRGGHVVNTNTNSNGASGTSGSGSNVGTASGAGSGGYMNNMKQQHQSQLQDVSSTNFFKNNV
jgi:hypothetical protein